MAKTTKTKQEPIVEKPTKVTKPSKVEDEKINLDSERDEWLKKGN